MSFSIALSGLRAASSDLDVTAHNIANSNTSGFKASKAEFGDVYAATFADVGATTIGSGVTLSDVSQQFSQGNIEFTESGLDLAINGEGFFAMDDGGTQVYSRAGRFHVDRDGYVVNAANQKLQAFAPIGPGQFSTSIIEPLMISTAEAPPRATGEVSMTLNLSASAAVPAASVFDAADPASYTSSTTLTAYDSLGEAHVGTIYFVKTANNNWNSHLAIDGNLLGGAATPVNQPLIFNADGSFDTGSGTTLNFGAHIPNNGAGAMDITFSVADITQFGSPFQVSHLSQDGYASGRLAGIDINDTGIVQARYTNGQTDELGQVVMVNFSNPQGLRNLGSTTWAASYNAGEPVYGAAGSGTLGLLQSGALESSNVDLSGELVNLIVAQRNFQANAQAISAADTVTQTIINMR